MAAILRKYATAATIEIPIVKRAVQDFAVGADWTPAAGDVKISKDGGAAANIGTLPTAIAMGNGAIWTFTLTGTEMTAARVVVTVADSATKAVEDQAIIIETYGNASATHAFDLGTAMASQTVGTATAVTTVNGLAANVITATSINADAITAAKVADGTIDAATFAAGAINAAAIATDAITNAKIAADAIGASEIADGAIDASTFAAGAIDAAAIATDAIGSAELAASAVTEIQSGLATSAALATVQADTDDIQTRLPAALVSGRIDASVGAIAANAITATSIATDAITAAKIAADAIGASEIADGAIDAATFASGAITAAAIATDAIGAAELAADAVTEIQSGLATSASIAALNNLSAATVKTQVTDALSVDTYAELTDVPAATSSLKDKLTWLFMLGRNRLTQTATTMTVFADDGTTALSTSTVSDDATTFVRGEIVP